ncbi:MAG: hypothetical protein HYX93_00380 [Chloroflexi bacterium]|nr:hypothetical protein [Chloroflexota bacterium]
MPTLIDTLRSFNRKESFYLVGKALGNASFQLSEPFRGELSSKIGVPVPANAFWATDYHLDCLYAALHLWSHDSQFTMADNSQGHIEGNQRDVDLLVAFEKDSITHLVLLEAKGATAWTTKQMLSKSDRLRLIFGEDGKDFRGVEPHFLLTSPRRPRYLKTKLWPQWMRGIEDPTWILLSWPENLVKATRCGPDGKQSHSGKFWKVMRAP